MIGIYFMTDPYHLYHTKGIAEFPEENVNNTIC